MWVCGQTKLPLTIKAKDRIMLSTQTALPPFKATFIGLEAGDTPESVVSVTYHCAAFPSSPAGTYDITPSGPSSTAKYQITYQKGTLRKFSAADVARIGLQLSGSNVVLNQYTNFPSSYPVCKTGTTHVALDQREDGTWPRADNAHNPFVTRKSVLNFGRYPTGTNFENNRLYSGDDVRFRIAVYDNRAWDVEAMFLFRETWESTAGVDPDATWQQDMRIVSAEEMRRIHNAIGISTLKCKNSVKLFQKLGGGTSSSMWTPFPQLPNEAKTHLANYFDGVCLELHVGDDIKDPVALDAMAEIAKWTAEQGQECLVFMGGNPNTYISMPRIQRTYHLLWQKMHEKGVNYWSPHIIYHRQGRFNYGPHTPESAIDTLSQQQKWLIETLAPGGTSMFISPVPSPERMLPSTKIWVAFCVGGEVSDPRPLTVSASSSNTGLIPNSGLQIIGSGADRSLRVTPVSGATGWATITLTVTDGIRTKTTSFDVNVANDIQVLSQSSGRLNDSTTWGRNVPVGDISEDNTHTTGHPFAKDAVKYWLNLAANNHGGRFIWRIRGNHSVSVHKTSFGVEDMGCTVPFFGQNLDVLGAVLTSSSGENLVVGNLTLVHSGATVRAPDIAGERFNIRPTHGRVTFGGGTLQSGNADLADLRFENCYLAGEGTILVKGSESHDSRVVFRKNHIWHTVGFTGTFVVQDHGQLDLPGVAVENASFGVEVSGTGKLVLRNNTALKSLKIAGAVIPPGTYTYNSFTTAQQAYLISVASAATLTVVP